MTRYTFIIFLLLSLLAPDLSAAQAPLLQPVILAEQPHDKRASTQGLFFHNGLLYESSGGYGKSFLAIVQPDTGSHIAVTEIEANFFAEGIAPVGTDIYMLTWRSGTGFTFDLETLEEKGRFSYMKGGDTTEGWGLTTDGTHLIRSSGTAQITFHRPGDFARITAILVKDGDQPVRLLNELEYVEGRILANIWKSDEIAVIDPGTGRVTARIDLSPLRKRIAPGSGTANGIAYDQETGRLFVTGKLWDKLFVIGIEDILAK